MQNSHTWMASCHWITFKLNITKNKNEITCRQVFSWQGQTFIPLFLRRSRSKTYLFTCSGSISTSLRVLGNLWPRPLCIFSHYLILLSWAYWFKQFSTLLISESISLQLTSNTVFCTSEKCYQTFFKFLGDGEHIHSLYADHIKQDLHFAQFSWNKIEFFTLQQEKMTWFSYGQRRTFRFHVSLGHAGLIRYKKICTF